MLRLTALLGMAAMLALAWLISMNRKQVKLRPVVVGLVLQVIFAAGILRVPLVERGFQAFADGVTAVLDLCDEGTEKLFGCLLTGEAPVAVSLQEKGPNGAEAGVAESRQTASKAATLQGTAKLHGILILKMLPPIIFFSALTSLLYYLGILQRVVQLMAFVMTRLMGVSGAESLCSAGNTVLGMTAAPFLIKPHFPRLTDSELMSVMVGGFATSAGGMLAAYAALGADIRFLLAASFMSAPAALLIAKIILPETETPLTAGTVRTDFEQTDSNAIEAVASGTTTGLQLALNVAAMLISFLAMIALVNLLLGLVHDSLTIQRILGWVFSPLAFLMGVPFDEALQMGGFLGMKIGTNEYIAFESLGQANLSERTTAITTFALCGFANFGSIGIQIGGLSVLAPRRRKDLARFGLRAMIGGALASWLTAALAGILL